MIRFHVRRLPPELEVLGTLALDLHWTASHAGDELWKTIDARTWGLTRNPWFLLQDVPESRLEELATDASFRTTLERLARERDAYLHGSTWFTSTGTPLAGERVAYFSMEFGLGEALPLYAGGLGILAGDHLKTASDLGVPLVGIGILFQQGYFRQSIDVHGQQREAYPYVDPTTVPIQPVISMEGNWLRVPVELPGRTLWLRVWRANVGRVPLYLLDANEPINSPVDRGITAKLYGGGPESRLLQDLVLGIGGWRALVALGLEPTVAHLNEGHAAFVILERARQLSRRQHLSFREALWAARAGNVFTTHTPVAAGFDLFSPDLMAQYFPSSGSCLRALSLTLPELLALGRSNPDDASEPFNMAYFALRGSARANGVSRLHGAVSRRLFSVLYPRVPEHEVPVEHVTNGVHISSWASRSADALWTVACGKDRWSAAVDRLPAILERLPDEALWELRNAERKELLSYARARLAEQLARRGREPSAASRAVLDPDALTLGFARRFAEYKRPNLLLRDPERLVRLLSDTERPVQLLVAGKSHPDNEAGKQMVAEWIAFVNRADVRHRTVFLEDYDMALARHLAEGVDVWLNTPRRSWEACGTSGMKVLANGGLNLSELDGWWAEAYAPERGWTLSDGGSSDDANDADALYTLLERDITPEFFDRDERGIPRRWLARVRASMAQLTPTFSSHRMMLEYVERFYAGAATEYLHRARDDASVAKSLTAWEQALGAHFGEVRVTAEEALVGEGEIRFRVLAHLGKLSQDAVRVELFADPHGEGPPFCAPMSSAGAEPVTGAHVYEATVKTSRPVRDFMPRVVPYHPDARIPAECARFLWAERGFSSREPA